MSESGIITIRGREYQTVALRVARFRERHPLWTIRTEIIHINADEVLMRAEILDEFGRLLADGYAEEQRAASQINRTSAVENCQTSAIGRALAGLGFTGTEFASAEEVQTAIRQQDQTAAEIAQALADIQRAADGAQLGEVGSRIARMQVDDAARKQLRSAFAARRKALEAAA